MRIVSLNCFCGRIPGVIDFLKSQDADIYCLQEVTIAADGMPVEPVYFKHSEKSSPYPTNPRLLMELEAAFPGYRLHYNAMALATNTTKSGVIYKMSWGILTLVRKNFKGSGYTLKHLAGNFDPDFTPSRPTPGIASATILTHPDTQRGIVVCNVHGMWTGNGKNDCTLREYQAQNLSTMLSRATLEDDAVVVCGDFNLLPDSATFDTLKRECGLRNISRERGLTSTRTAYYTGNAPEADYVLMNDVAYAHTPSGALRIVTDPVVSDHCPLILDLDL